MTEDLLSEADWMRHSRGLCRARLNKSSPGDPPELAVKLRYELRIRDWCLENSARAEFFQGSAAVWWGYMVDHARLQIAKYSGEIDESEFISRCKTLRDQRDQADLSFAGVAWLIQATS
jgi:hypothetical protein